MSHYLQKLLRGWQNNNNNNNNKKKKWDNDRRSPFICVMSHLICIFDHFPSPPPSWPRSRQSPDQFYRVLPEPNRNRTAIEPNRNWTAIGPQSNGAWTDPPPWRAESKIASMNQKQQKSKQSEKWTKISKMKYLKNEKKKEKKKNSRNNWNQIEMKKKLIGDLFIKLKWKEMERNGKKWKGRGDGAGIDGARLGKLARVRICAIEGNWRQTAHWFANRKKELCWKNPK